tara:strand:- start:94 stop:231 length:138 start_codon:yes stop_codon:yes gene_type:complete
MFIDTLTKIEAENYKKLQGIWRVATFLIKRPQIEHFIDSYKTYPM